MIYSFSKLLVFLSFLLSSLQVCAQIKDILRDPKLTEDLLEVLTELGAEIESQSDQLRINSALKSYESKVRNSLMWSGYPGYLFEIKAFINGNQKITKLSDPLPCGPGKTPLSALTFRQIQGVVLESPPDGLRYSASNSYFIWASIDTINGKVKYELIPSNFTKEMWYAVGANLASDSVISTLRNRRKEEVLKHQIEFLERISEDSVIRNELRTLKEQMDKDDRKLSQINKQLSRTLNSIQRSQNILNQIQLVGNTISFATSVASLYQSVGASPPDDAALILESNNAVSSRLNKIQTDLDTLSKQQKTLRDSISNSKDDSEARILVIIQSEGGPPNGSLF